MKIKSHVLQLLIVVDQVFNVLLGGYADETLSARAHRMRIKGQPYWGWTANAIDELFFWQEGHCELAYLAEVKRRQFPPGDYKA